jgi:hypothetical protein
LPGIIVASGTFLNGRFTKRLPLIGAWLGCFALQGVVRRLVFHAPLGAVWMPMTGVAFVLFTFYMVTDPATTPEKPARQVAFGALVAAVYGILITLHIVFGLFFALSIVCALRGIGLYLLAWYRRRALAPERAETVIPAKVALVGGRV